MRRCGQTWEPVFGMAASRISRRRGHLGDAQAELDRFCNALISIREEVAEIENGSADKCAPAPAASSSRLLNHVCPGSSQR